MNTIDLQTAKELKASDLTELFEVMDRERKEREGILYDMNSSPGCIMNCTREKLKNICGCFLTRFDDYIQLSAKKNNYIDNESVTYFANSYNALEKVYFHLKMGGLVSNELRNELRCFIKEAEQKAAVELCDVERYDHGQLQVTSI